MAPASLLIAPGSRHEAANADTRLLAAELAKHGYPIAVAAFLELAEPDINAGAAECVSRGATEVILLPHFLSEGVHVRRHLTDARAPLAQQFPGASFRLAEPIGPHPLLLQLLIERARAAGRS